MQKYAKFSLITLLFAFFAPQIALARQASPSDNVANHAKSFNYAKKRYRPLPADKAVKELSDIAAQQASATSATAATLYQHSNATPDPFLSYYLARRAEIVERQFRKVVDGAAAPLSHTFSWKDTFGCLNRWQVAGPFENASNSGMYDQLPPEKGESAPFVGKFGTIEWRTLAGGENRQCVTHIDSYYPTDSAVFIAQAPISLPTSQPALLAVGASGAYELWVNDQYVGHQPTSHSFFVDAQVWNINLKKGNNIITLKLADDNGRLLFEARLLNTKTYKPVDFTPTPDNQLYDLTLTKTPPPPKNLTQEGWGARFQNYQTAIEKKKVAPREALRFAQLLSKIQFHEPLKPWLTILDIVLRDKNSTPYDIALAARLADEPWRQKQIVAQALEKLEEKPVKSKGYDVDRQRYLVLTEQAKILGESSVVVDQLKGRQQLLKLTEEYPDAVEAKMSLIDYYIDKGLHPLARPILESLLASAEKGVNVNKERLLDYQLMIEQSVGTQKKVDQVQELLKEERPLTYASLMSYVTEKIAKKDYDGALKLVRAYQENYPDSVSAVLLEANLLEGAGKAEDAILVLAKGAETFQGDTWLKNAYASALLRQHRTDDALKVLDHALQYQPQDESIRRRVASLKPKSVPFYASFVIDDLAAFAKEHPAKPFASDVLIDQTVVYASPNGLTRTYNQLVMRANTVDGVDEAATLSVGYRIGDEQVDIVGVKVYKPDGTVSEEFHKNYSHRTRKQSTTYNDIAMLYLTASNVKPGDLVEFQWTLSQVANTNFRGDYFGEVQFLQTSTPIAYERFVVLAPTRFQLHFRNPTLPHMRGDQPFDQFLADVNKGRTKKLTNPGLKDYQVTTFELLDVPQIEGEPHSVGTSEMLDYIVVSNKSSWDDVGRWWWELIKDQLVVDDAIAAEVKKLTKDLKTDDEKIAAIHDYVVKNTRYLHVGLGIHGWKPYRTSDIFRNRYGDCKDKAALLKVMLEEAGIPTNLVLVRTNDLGNIASEPASMHIFNHAIAYIPSKKLFLDGTAEFNGVHELTSMDQAAQGLIVKDGGESTLVELPVDQADQNTYDITLEIRLSEKNSSVKGEIVGTGTNASYLRTFLEDPKRRNENLESMLAGSYPGLTIRTATYSDLKNLNIPVKISFTGEGGDFIGSSGEGGALFPKGSQTNYIKYYAPTSTRKQGVALPPPSKQISKIIWTAPDKMTFKSIPSDTRIDSKFGSATITYKLEGKQLITTTTMTFSTRKIPADEYQNFREFLIKVDKAFNTQVMLGK